MKKVLLLLVGILLIYSVSAEIIITKQPVGTYNLGEMVTIPVTIKTLTDVSNSLEMTLLCNGHEINFYKNGVFLSSGEEKKFEASLILTESMIGKTLGACKIKIMLGDEYILTDDFSISSQISLHNTIQQTEIFPGKEIIIDGGATKESGKDVNGFLEIEISKADTANATTYLKKLDTINNGFFSVNITAPEDMPAGEYLIKLIAYEKSGLGEITNLGYGNNKFLVLQIANNIEIIIENPIVEPGTSARIKAILHDQTGENIDSLTTLTITDSKNQIREKIEVATNEFFDFPILSNEPPEEFKIVANTGELSSEMTFQIIEKPKIDVFVLNRTLSIINTGNVPYCNKSVLVKIGEETLNLDVCLNLGEEQKYSLSAPDGEYLVEIITEEETKTAENIVLTGNAISIKEASSSIGTLTRHPFIWLFVMGILGFIAMTIYKKGYQRSFIGRIGIGRKKETYKTTENTPNHTVPMRKKSLINTKNKAELSLSIKGDKQNVSIVALKIKNLRELESEKGNSEETLQKIVNLAEENKALSYENQDNIFFIFSPTKTKTFKNEKIAIELANKIQPILIHHNKMFKQKIDYGIALNYGTIVGKQELQSFNFMSMGTLITTAKKLSTISKGEILLAEKIKERVDASVKTERKISGTTKYFTIKSIQDTDQHKQFIKSFLERIEKK